MKLTIIDGEQDCDAVLEEHIWDYDGQLGIPSMPKVHLAICCANMGWVDRKLKLLDGPISVADIVKEFGLAPFLSLFDRQEGARFHKGDVVQYCNQACRIL